MRKDGKYMKKRWLIGIVIVILLAIGIIAGVYMHKRNEAQYSNMVQNKLAETKGEGQQGKNNEVISTSTTEEKISPNSTITEKQYFKGCDHLIKTTKNVPENLINQTQEELQKEYSGWKIEKFSNTEIMVYQEQEGYCHQHYLVKEHNGVLGIYMINENGTETLKEDTEISTQYLPEEDLMQIKNGIEAIGDMELHTILEDFE